MKTSLSISAAIQAHPQRAHLARRLVGALRPLHAHIAYDPEPSGAPTALRSAYAAWSCVGASATHHLVLQDDVELCGDFAAALTRSVEQDSSAVLGLFTVWLGERAQLVRLCGAFGQNLMRATPAHVSPEAILMPAELAREYGTFLEDALALKDGGSRDTLTLRHFLKSRRARIRVVVPNIVQHDSFSQSSFMPLTGIASGLRQSAYFRASETDRLTSEATSESVFDPRRLAAVPSLSLDRGGVVAASDQKVSAWEWLRRRKFAWGPNAMRLPEWPRSLLSSSLIRECHGVVFIMGNLAGDLDLQLSLERDRFRLARVLGTILPAALWRTLSPDSLHHIEDWELGLPETFVEGLNAGPRLGL